MQCKLTVHCASYNVLSSCNGPFAVLCSLGDEGWNRLAAVLNFGVFNGPTRIQTPQRLFWDFEMDKPLQPDFQAEEFKSESKFEPLQAMWQSLPKATPEDNRRFRLQNQWQNSWGSAPAQLWRIGLVSTNRGCFGVGCSRCWPRPVRLRKTCYHSCDTDLGHTQRWEVVQSELA